MWIDKIYVLLAPQFAALSLDQDFYSPKQMINT